MQDWQTRLAHEKAIRDVQCALLGKEIPQDVGNKLTPVPGLDGVINTPECRTQLLALGHDAILYKFCQCSE